MLLLVVLALFQAKRLGGARSFVSMQALELEITEDIMLDHDDQVLESLRRLRGATLLVYSFLNILNTSATSRGLSPCPDPRLRP